MGFSADLTPAQARGLLEAKVVLDEFHQQMKTDQVGIGETYTFPDCNDFLPQTISTELVQDAEGTLYLAHSGRLADPEEGRNGRRLHDVLQVRPLPDGSLHISAFERTKMMNGTTEPTVIFAVLDEVQLTGAELTVSNVRRKLEQLRDKHAPRRPDSLPNHLVWRYYED